jgi:sugar O-acyltransferase (sialic acid O-acetyltransferase NeuD family)
MSRRPVVIMGAGGHGAVLADALLAEGRTVLGFVDARPEHACGLPGLELLGTEADLDAQAGYELANGVGGTGAGAVRDIRRRAQARLEALGFHFTGVRHPSAIISPHAIIAEDVQLFARSVVQAHARIESGSIINTGAIVEHGCRIGAFTHCASGSIVCGDVDLGDGSHIGAGAVIRQGTRLEAGVVVGAGAVVLNAGDGGGMLVGVPARRRGST